MNSHKLQKALKQSRFWTLKEVALSVKDPLIQLLFWEHFFVLFFEATGAYPAMATKLVPPPLKEQLNKHFSMLAQPFNNESQRKAYTTYYSFTTWSKDVIFGKNKKLFSIEDRQLIDVLHAAYPPPFKVQPIHAPPPVVSSVSSASSSPSLPVNASPQQGMDYRGRYTKRNILY